MISPNRPTRRWLCGFAVGVVCMPGGANAQTAWQPVDPPTYSESGRLSWTKTPPLGDARHAIDLPARGRAHAWLEWDDAAIELNMTVWRDGMLLASSSSIGSRAQYVPINPGQPGRLEVRVASAWGHGFVAYRLRIWQDELLRWSLAGAREPLVAVGQSIIMVEHGAKPLKVRIAEIGPNGIVTMHQGRSRELPATRVARIQRGDSLLNGALIGLLSGAGFALNRLGNCEMNCYGAFVPVLGGIGAGIGAVVDAMRRSTTLHIVSDAPR